MPRDNKKLIVLICLVVFWIGLILVQRSQGPGLRRTQVASGLQRSSAQRRGSVTPPRRQAEKQEGIPRLKLDRIERVRPPFDPEARNIFGSIESLSAVRPPAPPKPQAALSLPPPPDPFLEEAKQVRFLGYAKADGKPMAFVAYADEALVVPEAEVFGNQFRVKSITEDSMVLTSLDGTKEILLRLSPESAGALPSRETQRGKMP